MSKKENKITVFYNDFEQKNEFRLNGVDVTDTIELLKEHWETEFVKTRCKLFQFDMSIQMELQKQVSDLEAKLTESEKYNKMLLEEKGGYIDLISGYSKKCKDYEQQLAEKDIKIERLKQDYDEVWEDTLFRVKEDFKLNNNCNECRRYYAEEFNKQLDQYKISFAVEQLEKVLKILEEKQFYKKEDTAYCVHPAQIAEYINNQIKQLKEGK